MISDVPLRLPVDFFTRVQLLLTRDRMIVLESGEVEAALV